MFRFHRHRELLTRRGAALALWSILACSFAVSGQEPQFPTIFQIFRNPAVREAMDKGLASRPQRQSRVEHGGWVRWNSETGKFTVSPLPPGDEASLGSGAVPPDSGSTYSVGFYHTHPPNDQYPNVGPSPQDKFKASVQKLPNLVKDKNPKGPGASDYED